MRIKRIVVSVLVASLCAHPAMANNYDSGLTEMWNTAVSPSARVETAKIGRAHV